MFSTGHLLWIGICAVLIVAGTLACLRRRPTEDRLLKICLAIGVLSEAAKLFSVMRILPMVDIAVKGAALEYIPAGQYTPYLEMRYLMAEVCGLCVATLREEGVENVYYKTVRDRWQEAQDRNYEEIYKYQEQFGIKADITGLSASDWDV